MQGLWEAFHPLHTFYSACDVSAGPQLAGKPQARILWLSDNRTGPELLTRDLVLLYILGVQNLKHSEATFALFFFLFLSLSDSLVAVSSIAATKCDATSLR